jgi:AraC family transcriptional regulator
MAQQYMCDEEPMSDIEEESDDVCYPWESPVIQGTIALWHQDHRYHLRYVTGIVDTAEKTNPIEPIRTEYEQVEFPTGEYAVFTTRRCGSSEELAENTKKLTHYLYKRWFNENKSKVSEKTHIFELYRDYQVYLYVELLPREEWKRVTHVEHKKKKLEIEQYEVAEWKQYIDEHILEHLTVKKLARQLYYSESVLRHTFKQYYNISVAEYIRKKRLELSLQDILQGMAIQDVAQKYRYASATGFSRAFEKQYYVLPREYVKAQFEDVDMAGCSTEFEGSLKMTCLAIKELKMIGKSVLTGSYNDVDIAAQVQYWLRHEFPCLENTRFYGKKCIREDKISLWWHEPDIVPTDKDICYLLGPVVDDFEEAPEEMHKITIPAGRYAIFTTDKQSDRETVAETFRIFSRCIFYSWLKREENREKLDESRCVFHRYVDDKIYLYVPLKPEPKML